MVVCAALAGGLTACRVSALDGLIYFPDAEVPSPPPGVEERAITTADGERLHAWYAPARRDGAGGQPDAAPVVMWSHGNGGNIAYREDVILALAARGLDVLAYDYRGYGRSTGSPGEAGLYRDAEAVYDDLLARGVPPSRLVCFGESLGGAVSIALALERPCAGVIVVSTFTRLRDVARAHYGPLGFLAGDRFDSLSRIDALEPPLLVAHGDRDEIVPYELGEALYRAAPQPKRFLRVAGRMHNDVFFDRELLDAIAAFAHEVTAAPPSP